MPILFSLLIQSTVGPGANAFAFCVVSLLPYPQMNRRFR